MQEICSVIREFIARPNASAEAFNALARRVLAFQFERNGGYRAFCQARGITPERVERAEWIPAIVTSAFKELELSVLPEEARTVVFYSSGTTEQRRSRHYHSEETLAVYEESVLRWFEPHVVADRKPVDFLVLTPTMEEAPNSSLVHMFETVAMRFGKTWEFAADVAADRSWVLDFDEIIYETEEQAKKNRPMVICGTAFSFVHLCDELSKRGRVLEFPAGSRVFETGGYKGRSRAVAKEELHAMISERLTVPEAHIVSEYGMSEISSQAYDRKTGSNAARVFRFPHWARSTVISPETGAEVEDGETGLVRIVDLANVGSVLAIQTEDLAVRRSDGFELVGRASEAEARGCSLMQVEG
ncbi:MAG: LuxE/PaaK family acyltransferase [Limisphaerales bacterium]